MMIQIVRWSLEVIAVFKPHPIAFPYASDSIVAAAADAEGAM